MSAKPPSPSLGHLMRASPQWVSNSRSHRLSSGRSALLRRTGISPNSWTPTAAHQVEALCQELVLGRWYRRVLLQREIEESLAGHLNLVALGDYFRTRAGPSTDPGADRRSFAAT